jgi:hypothetical protein
MFAMDTMLGRPAVQLKMVRPDAYRTPTFLSVAASRSV